MFSRSMHVLCRTAYPEQLDQRRMFFVYQLYPPVHEVIVDDSQSDVKDNQINYLLTCHRNIMCS